ncbi:MAG: septum formation initiator family protein [Tissierellia bacterium]|nr:septum formation initiator family protein [Tissierellia bacterium]
MRVRRRRASKLPLIILILVLIFGGLNILRMELILREKRRIMEANGVLVQQTLQDVKDLGAELKRADSVEYTEEVAREDLGMVKPKERIFVDKNRERQQRREKEGPTESREP